jgi:hypothetical protein
MTEAERIAAGRELISYIAKAANTTAMQAGVGGMETAGGIISFLAANPEYIPAFMEGVGIADWPVDFHQQGCLSWHGMDGKVHWPKGMVNAN